VGPAIKVDFIVGERDRRLDGLERQFAEVRSRIAGDIDAMDVDYPVPLRLDRIRGLRYLRYLFRSAFYPRRVRRLRRPGAIAHLPNQKLGILLHKVDLSPSVIFCHDVAEYVLPEYRLPFLYRSFVVPYHTGMARAGTIVTPSRFTADEVRRSFGVPETRLRVIPDGVDLARFTPGDGRPFLRHFNLPEGRRYLLVVGSEQPRKDVPTAVKAFLKARRSANDLVLLKVGRPDELLGSPVRKSLLREVRDAGAAESVRFLDFVPDELLPAAYRSARALLFPSRYEGFGLPPLEAMACGTPVVASDAPAVVETAGGAALHVKAGDHEAMASETLRVLDDEDLRSRLATGGASRASGFGWDRAARSFVSLYREIASRA
jgi:glycosyltransferase involved in cell wall biosynthesis